MISVNEFVFLSNLFSLIIFIFLLIIAYYIWIHFKKQKKNQEEIEKLRKDIEDLKKKNFNH
jgi:preprotein translocase subunit YajC